MLAWIWLEESLSWPSVDGRNDDPARISRFVSMLSAIMGDENAVEFRLRFL